MQNSFNITLVLLLVLGVPLLYFAASPKGRSWFKQWNADRERRRAHAGKLTCEDFDCSSIATMITPNGYFCEWHWEPNSQQRLPGGGYVTWNHRLRHTTRRV